MMAKVLVVEDENDIRELLQLHLKREGHQVLEAPSAEKALALLASPVDLCLVDWMLPETSGLELIRAIRSSHGAQLPVLMLTARVEPSDVVAGLEAGADDYVTKPFEIPVVLARVRALLRRAKAGATSASPQADSSVLTLENLSLDTRSHAVTLDGKELSLTRYEFRLLQALMQNTGRVLTRESLIDKVQGSEVSVVDRAIDTHVFGLRKKLGSAGNLIETVRGVGYRVRS